MTIPLGKTYDSIDYTMVITPVRPGYMTGVDIVSKGYSQVTAYVWMPITEPQRNVDILLDWIVVA